MKNLFALLALAGIIFNSSLTSVYAQDDSVDGEYDEYEYEESEYEEYEYEESEYEESEYE